LYKMSNDESLIYVLVFWVFHNVHFRHFGDLKIRFLIIRERVLLSQWFWIYLYCDYKYLSYHLFLILPSDYLSSNTRIPHSMSCINLSNDESLIYLLVSGEFRNVHFRHFGKLKMRYLLIRQRVLLSQWFRIYLYWE